MFHPVPIDIIRMFSIFQRNLTLFPWGSSPFVKFFYLPNINHYLFPYNSPKSLSDFYTLYTPIHSVSILRFNLFLYSRLLYTSYWALRLCLPFKPQTLRCAHYVKSQILRCAYYAKSQILRCACSIKSQILLFTKRTSLGPWSKYYPYLAWYSSHSCEEPSSANIFFAFLHLYVIHSSFILHQSYHIHFLRFILQQLFIIIHSVFRYYYFCCYYYRYRSCPRFCLGLLSLLPL